MTKIIDYSNNLNPRTSSPQNYAKMAKEYEQLKKLAYDNNGIISTGQQKSKIKNKTFFVRDLK